MHYQPLDFSAASATNVMSLPNTAVFGTVEKHPN